MIRHLAVLTCLTLLAPGAVLAQDERGGLDEDKLVELLEQAAEKAKKKHKQEMSPISANRKESAAAHQIRRTLDNQDITANFNETAFTDCLEFIRDVTGMNVVLSKGAKKEFAEEEVSLRLKRVKIRSLLNLLLEQVSKDLRYGVKHGVLWIGLKDEWKTKKTMLFLDVNDILHTPPDFPGPKIGLKDGGVTFED